MPISGIFLEVFEKNIIELRVGRASGGTVGLLLQKNASLPYPLNVSHAHRGADIRCIPCLPAGFLEKVSGAKCASVLRKHWTAHTKKKPYNRRPNHTGLPIIAISSASYSWAVRSLSREKTRSLPPGRRSTIFTTYASPSQRAKAPG